MSPPAAPRATAPAVGETAAAPAMSPIFPAVRSALRTGAPWKCELAAATADLTRLQSVVLPTDGWAARAGAPASGAAPGRTVDW